MLGSIPDSRCFWLQLRYSQDSMGMCAKSPTRRNAPSVTKQGLFRCNVSSSSGVGRDDKDLIVRVDLGGRISHEDDSIEIASKSGRQTLQLRIDHAAN
jgi:hypothetical protein